MKKAVIAVGGNQFIVSEGDTIEVDHLKDTKSSVDFDPLLVIDGSSVKIGAPEVTGSKVTAKVAQSLVKADKVTSIRYKSKKRVHKVHGHRQHQTQLEITKIV